MNDFDKTLKDIIKQYRQIGFQTHFWRSEETGEVWLTIRHALAWHDKPEGDPWNVCFDKPLNRSDQPQPVVKLNEKQEAKKK